MFRLFFPFSFLSIFVRSITFVSVQLSDFLFGQLGLVFGSNAVITNGRVSFMVHVDQLNDS